MHRFLLYCVGIGWLLLLPMDDISGKVYTDENALLPGYASDHYSGDRKVIQLAEQLNQVTWSVVILSITLHYFYYHYSIDY